MTNEQLSDRQMDMRIGDEFEEIVRNKVERGSYDSPSAVIGEALRLLEQRDRFLLLQRDDIREKIAAGLLSLRAGRAVDGESVFERLDDELDAADLKDS